MPTAWADFDVNAIAGQVLLDEEAAPSGTLINVTDTTKGFGVIVPVDGSNLPPFAWGAGRYDTGDIPQFDSGDSVIVQGADPSHVGAESAVLVGGTTIVNLSLTSVDSPEGASLGSADDSSREVEALMAENERLMAENEKLRIGLEECESQSGSLDYLATLDTPNLSGGSGDGIAQTLYYLMEEAYWSADYAARTMGTRTVGLLDQMETISDSLLDAGGSILDSLLGFVPALMDGRMLAIMAAVMGVGFSLTVIIVGRDSRRRFRQRIEAMRQERITASDRPFWDEAEI